MLEEEGPTRHALAAKTRWTITPLVVSKVLKTHRHPMELAEGVIDPNLQYCGNCQKVCVRDRARKDALFKLHIESGLVDIPKDPTMIAHLEDVNQELVPYDIERTGYDLKDVDYGWVKD